MHIHAYLKEGGSSLICKIIGQMSLQEELKTAMPSVFNLNEMLFAWLRKFPGLQSSLHKF